MLGKRAVLVLSCLFALLSLSFMIPVGSFAQGGESGGVTGIVKDTSGAVVAGASVAVYSEQTGSLERTVVSDSSGGYTIAPLRPGRYRAEVSTAGFRKHVVKFDARLDEITRLDLVLEVGTITETVTVQAGDTLINTEAPTTGQPIDNQTLTTLPLAEPNFLFLLGLSPGTGTEPADVRKAGRANVDISVNGQRTSNNSVTVEGISVNDFNLAHFDYLPIPNPESIQEFKIATSLYDASLGSKGGGALALILKSGTNGLHWGAWWDVRNDAFNANDWFRNAGGQPRAKLTQNVVGIDGSGPVPIAKGYWFFNVQGIRGRNAIDPNGSSTTHKYNAFPTNPDGTTSAALLATAYGLPQASIDPVAVNILNLKGSYYGGTYFIPRPGQAGCDSTLIAPTGPGQSATFFCNFSKVAIVSDTQYVGTYDRSLRHGKDRVLFRVFWDDETAVAGLKTAATLPGPLSSPIVNRFGTISYQTQISNRQLNEVKFGANRFVFATKPTDLATLAQVGAMRANSASFPGLYQFNTGTFSFGTGVNDDRGTASNTYQWGDNWTMTAGKHTLRAGGDLYRYQLNRFNNFGTRGSVTFTPIGPSKAAGSCGQVKGCTTWQNFITGTITGTQSGAGNPQRYFRALAGDLYFQDDYRLSPRLTINLGLRWEPMQFAHDKFFRNSNYNYKIAQEPSNPFANPFLYPEALNQNGFTGTPGVSDCTLKHCWDLNNFAPRVGFAYDVFGNQKTVVRGGYGIYYQQISNQAELQGSLGAPFFVSLISTRSTSANQLPQQLANPFTGQSSGGGAIAPAFIPTASKFAGIAGGLDVNDPNAVVNWTDAAGVLCAPPTNSGTATDCSINAASFTSADPNLHAPYTQAWNLTVQRMLGHNWALEVGYIGDHSIGGIAIWVPFQAKLASPANPIVVKDVSGNVYTITNNTGANETLREQALGLTFGNGSSYTSNVGNQIYHSAQVLLSHRYQSGLFTQIGYTYGKNIDNVSGSISTDELNGSTGRGGAAIYNDQSNPALNRALSDLDRRHRLTIAYGYQIPVPKSSIFGSQAFQGWGVSGLITLQSGQVFTPSDGNAGGAYGFVNGTPLAICSNVVAGPGSTLPTCTLNAPTNPLAALTTGSIESRLGNYINPNFFSDPVAVANSNDPGATGFGTSMRNIYRGPFQSDVDFSISKSFHITERHRFVFRADAFNLFNHPIFSIPNSVEWTSPGTFGNITQTVIPARLLQLGLKYSF
jgi:Carboxypeptidase regulatory-like domain/TonB dependent receptor